MQYSYARKNPDFLLKCLFHLLLIIFGLNSSSGYLESERALRAVRGIASMKKRVVFLRDSEDEKSLLMHPSLTILSMPSHHHSQTFLHRLLNNGIFKKGSGERLFALTDAQAAGPEQSL